MALYDVTATQIINYTMEVEADSEAEAMAIAEEQIDGWRETGGEFTVDYAEKYEGDN